MSSSKEQLRLALPRTLLQSVMQLPAQSKIYLPISMGQGKSASLQLTHEGTSDSISFFVSSENDVSVDNGHSSAAPEVDNTVMDTINIIEGEEHNLTSDEQAGLDNSDDKNNQSSFEYTIFEDHDHIYAADVENAQDLSDQFFSDAADEVALEIELPSCEQIIEDTVDDSIEDIDDKVALHRELSSKGQFPLCQKQEIKVEDDKIKGDANGPFLKLSKETYPEQEIKVEDDKIEDGENDSILKLSKKKYPEQEIKVEESEEEGENNSTLKLSVKQYSRKQSTAQPSKVISISDEKQPSKDKGNNSKADINQTRRLSARIKARKSHTKHDDTFESLNMDCDEQKTIPLSSEIEDLSPMIYTSELTEVIPVKNKKFASKISKSTPQKEKDVQCPLCPKTYVSYQSALIHVREKHQDDPDHESLCIEIEQKCERDDTYILTYCPICNLPYHGDGILKHIKKIHSDHEDFDSVLSVCSHQVNVKKYERRKKLVEGDLYKHICSSCGQTYKTKHIMLHHFKYNCPYNPDRCKMYTCRFCCLRSPDSDFMKKHVATHNVNEKRFTCSKCATSYKGRTGLYMHIRRLHPEDLKNPDVKNYYCPECNKMFYTRTELARHMPYHTGERHFSCPICDKKFKGRVEMNRHVKTRHEGIYPFYCERCGHGLSKKKLLLSHRCDHINKKIRYQKEQEGKMRNDDV